MPCAPPIRHRKRSLKKNNIRYEGHLYEFRPWFFNDATPERYNQATAQQRGRATLEWFNQYVRGPSARLSSPG